MYSSGYVKSIEELTFTDDIMFQAVLHNSEICAELVEKLLQIKVNKVEYPELEKPIAPFFSSKGVRLDVYLKDADKIIDVEMQNYPQSSIGKRSRYYQSMIDIDSLMKGQDYEGLKDSYILFICKEDPFKSQLRGKKSSYRYTFYNTCSENKDVELGDKAVKVFYNSSAYQQAEDEGIRNFLRFINTNNPGQDDFSKRLKIRVEELKQNDIFRGEYTAMNLHDLDIKKAAHKEGLEEGLEKGREEGLLTAAIALLKNGESVEKVSALLNIPLERVKGLNDKAN